MMAQREPGRRAGTARAVRLDQFDSVDEFEAAAGAFLAAREAEHNLMLGILDTLRTAPGSYEGPPYLAVVRRGPAVVAAALRTPPYGLVLSEVDDAEAIPALVDAAVASGAPSVLGPAEAAEGVAAGWSARTGRRHRVAMGERIFRLRRVIPARRVSGRVRSAEPADRPLLLAWGRAFTVEALPDEDPSLAEAAVDRWLAREPPSSAYLWEDDGPVSLCVAGSRTPHGVRIGPVYTPPVHRGRGYASACVAAVSQVQLDAGRSFCFLYTDLANPTSNRIYQAIGYEPVRDVASIRFDQA